MNSERKKQIIYISIALLTITLLIVGATYAYFQNQYGDASQADVNVTTYTTDVLTFETGDPINITADQETFAKGKGNRSGSSFARAILQANNKTNEATANYYIYLNIESNEFTYTSEDQKAELVLQVTDKSGNPVTSIDGLTYVTVLDGNGNTIKGFDITEKSGLITLVNNKEIVASPRTEEQYDVTLILVNYDFDQNNNAGKSFNAKLMIQKESASLSGSNICKNDQSIESCIVSLYGKNNNLYYHDSSLANGAGDNSYRYAGADYLLTDTGKALGVTNVFSTSSTDTSGLIDYYCNEKKKFFGDYCYSTTYYYLIKNDTTKYSSYKEVINKALSNGYIVSNQVDNYVCFGSDESNCPVDNLYRIIGVFDGRVKLIKADYATSNLLGTDGDYKSTYSDDMSTYKGNLLSSDFGTYMWNYNGLEDKTINNGYGSNTWSTSLLNTVNLNTNYLNNIGSKWASMIDTTIWKVGSNEFESIVAVSSSDVFKNEVLNPVATNTTDNATEYSAKIGLMYVSDYGFAADPSAWTTTLYEYDNPSIIAQNWLYMGLYEWTISRIANYSQLIFYVVGSGRVSSKNANGDLLPRPVFSLLSSVKYSSGSGTLSDPFRISL